MYVVCTVQSWPLFAKKKRMQSSHQKEEAHERRRELSRAAACKHIDADEHVERRALERSRRAGARVEIRVTPRVVREETRAPSKEPSARNRQKREYSYYSIHLQIGYVVRVQYI